MMHLNDKLQVLQQRGCQPNISLRGNTWRAHINGAGNYWAEGSTPSQALNKAIGEWETAGSPLDGYAAIDES